MAVPSQFVSAEESDALARRAARFQQSGSAQNNGTIGGSSYFDPNDSGMSGGVAVGGKKRLRGKAGLGYGGVETPEVDPVRHLVTALISLVAHRWRIVIFSSTVADSVERPRLGPLDDQRYKLKAREILLETYFGQCFQPCCRTKPNDNRNLLQLTSGLCLY